MNYELIKVVDCHLMQNGWTALHAATYNQRFDIVEYLVEQCGADVSIKDPVNTEEHRHCWLTIII